jgi:hypothetical protein
MQLWILWTGNARSAKLAERALREVILYSGIQTPKKSKPHWLNPGFQIGFSW